MDFYQGVVLDYLRADRAVFVNAQCCIQLNKKANPDTSGPHWYCDAVVLDLRNKTVFLCEISYAAKLGALLDRLNQWSQSWQGIHAALIRDCEVPAKWPVRPWLFVPEESIELLVAKVETMKSVDGLAVFTPRITPLQAVQPWRYHSWNHRDENTEKLNVPEAMRF